MPLKPDQPLEIWIAQKFAEDQPVNVIRAGELPSASDLEKAVYTSIRTYFRDSGNPGYLQLDLHLRRLHESLDIEQGDFQFEDSSLRQAISQVVARSEIQGDLKIKVIIAPKRQNPTLFTVEALTTPSRTDYEKGVAIYTTTYIRKDPRAKVFEFVETQDQIRGQFGQKVEEIIMLDSRGGLLEGLSSNFFVIMGGAIYTAGRGILNGITRQIVLDIVKEQGLPLFFRKPAIRQIEKFDECFITSTSRGILPVISIDHKQIGPGKPGPMTQKLRDCFEARIPGLVKPI